MNPPARWREKQQLTETFFAITNFRVEFMRFILIICLEAVFVDVICSSSEND
jgi:hypothetical protein